jgi:hypothetical protein
LDGKSSYERIRPLSSAIGRSKPVMTCSYAVESPFCIS